MQYCVGGLLRRGGVFEAEIWVGFRTLRGGLLTKAAGLTTLRGSAFSCRLAEMR